MVEERHLICDNNTVVAEKWEGVAEFIPLVRAWLRRSKMLCCVSFSFHFWIGVVFISLGGDVDQQYFYCGRIALSAPTQVAFADDVHPFLGFKQSVKEKTTNKQGHVETNTSDALVLSMAS